MSESPLSPPLPGGVGMSGRCRLCDSCGDPGCLCGSECHRTAPCPFPAVWEETKAALREGWGSAFGYRQETRPEVLERMERMEAIDA